MVLFLVICIYFKSLEYCSALFSQYYKKQEAYLKKQASYCISGLSNSFLFWNNTFILY